MRGEGSFEMVLRRNGEASRRRRADIPADHRAPDISCPYKGVDRGGGHAFPVPASGDEQYSLTRFPVCPAAVERDPCCFEAHPRESDYYVEARIAFNYAWQGARD